MIKKTCSWCKKTFEASQNKTKFCSRRCMGMNERRRVIKQCCYCGKKIEIIQARQKGFKYCSHCCQAKAVLRSPEVQKKITRKYGKDHPNWKGGFIDSAGYKTICVFGRRIREHRYVMEQFLGRNLNQRENVHHKNHNKLDNRIENLELIDVSEHTKRHHKEGLFKPMGWSKKWKTCQGCGTNEKKHHARGYCTACLHKFPSVMGS